MIRKDALENLIGKEFTSIAITQDQSFIHLIRKDGLHVYLRASGDCCTSSYFVEDVLNPDYLIGTPWIAIEAKLITHEEDNDEGVQELWGYSIKTAKGICDIEMRSSHNGFYGGMLEYEDDNDEHWMRRKGNCFKDNPLKILARE